METYDEFSMFHENAEEYGIAYGGPPVVRREFVDVGQGRRLSALVWGEKDPEFVFLHGGAQNAHTWDTVALALGRPIVAIDLPGHGHSDGGEGGSLDVSSNARDVAIVIRELAPRANVVIGMSLGGITTVALAGHAPELTRKIVLVDVTPGVNKERSAHIANFIQGPASFDSFDELLARTVEFHPSRSVSSLRRGILHNAVPLEDGTWVWRYARFREPEGQAASGAPDFTALWDIIGSLQVPLVLARGMRPDSVVGDDDVAELNRRNPSAHVVNFDEAGHSIQGDMPVQLAAFLAGFAE